LRLALPGTGSRVPRGWNDCIARSRVERDQSQSRAAAR
jgi:hypothetical protein